MTSRFGLGAVLVTMVSGVAAVLYPVTAAAGPGDGAGPVLGLVAAVFLVVIVVGALRGLLRAVRRSRRGS